MCNEDHAAIVREFTDYIIGFVERQKPELGNMPVCPFARKARLTGQMRIEVLDLTLDAIAACVSGFADEPRLDFIICVHPRRDALSCEQVYRLAKALNRTLPDRNVLARPGHPDDPFNIDGLYTRREPYPNIQLVRGDVGARAYRNIESSGYYDRWSEENFRDLIPGVTLYPDFICARANGKAITLPPLADRTVSVR